MGTGLHAVIAPQVFDGTTMRGRTAVVHRAGRIESLLEPGELPADCPRTQLPDDAVLAPGFIDIQVNGGGGILFNDAPSIETIQAITAAHRRFGTTACLPTLISDTPEKMTAAAAVRTAGLAGCLGLHFEGPFFNPARKGVHDAGLFGAPDARALELLSQATVVTLAPECVPEGFIRALTKRGVRVAAGHSDATAARVHAAVAEGLSGVTHLFNAMSPLQARAPGIVGAALADDRLYAGIICDGIHVDPVAVRAAWRAKGSLRLMLVTDAMPTVGGSADSFVLQGRTIRLDRGRLTNEDGTLAGAHLDMASAVRNAVRLAGIPLADALAMASATPAAFLGLQQRFGRLAPGFAADLVGLDGDLVVIGSWRAGAPA